MGTKPTAKSQEPDRELDAAKHVAEAHELLSSLRAKLDKHPELEEAILKLEMALNALTIKSGGML